MDVCVGFLTYPPPYTPAATPGETGPESIWRTGRGSRMFCKSRVLLCLATEFNGKYPWKYHALARVFTFFFPHINYQLLYRFLFARSTRFENLVFRADGVSRTSELRSYVAFAAVTRVLLYIWIISFVFYSCTGTLVQPFGFRPKFCIFHAHYRLLSCRFFFSSFTIRVNPERESVFDIITFRVWRSRLIFKK